MLPAALRYIKEARQKDPTVTLQQTIVSRDPDINGKPGLITPDALEAEVLYIQAMPCLPEITRERDEDGEVQVRAYQICQAQKAISLLEQCISLNPRLSHYYVKLAYAYGHNREIEKALAILENAAQKFPNNFKVRSTFDYFRENPNFGVQPADTGAKTGGGMSLMSFAFLLLVVSLGTFFIFGTGHPEKTAIGMPMMVFSALGIVTASIIIYFGVKRKINAPFG
jgi:tetratricopeptide (TPR) repeat protein